MRALDEGDEVILAEGQGEDAGVVLHIGGDRDVAAQHCSQGSQGSQGARSHRDTLPP